MRKTTSFDLFIKASNQPAISWCFFLLRLLIGILFFSAGWSKLQNEAWTAAGYLEQATGPFASWFQSLAGNGFVDALNAWGLTLIGIALIVGVFVRAASMFGFILMLLYFLAQYNQNTAHGFIDEHIVYACVFLLFMFGGFGHIWGIDALLERRIDPRSKWIKFFLG